MKNLTKTYLFALLCGFGFATMWMNTAQAQTQMTVCPGEELCLTIPTPRGNIQWQQSLDSLSWGAVGGGTNDTLCVFPSLSLYFRAEVTEGTCDPVYSDVIFVEVLPGIFADAGANMEICFGDSVMLGGSPAGQGGTGALTYLWTPNGATTTNPMVAPASTTDYILTVTDSLGCMRMDTVTVNVLLPPSVDAGADTTIGCADMTPLGGAPTATGGAGGYSYSWSPTNGLSSSTVANPSAMPGGSTTYTCTVTDSIGCSATDMVTITTTGQGTGIDSFAYTGSVQQFIVPSSCVDSITMDVYGAQGGANWVNNDNFGGNVTATFAVTPGDTLWIYVGQQPNSNTGGWNGGGNGENAGRGGGGASDVRVGGQTLNDRIIVAGGGGGAGFWSNQHVVGGGGGGLTGGDGYRSTTANAGGQGATQTGSGTGTCVTFNNASVSGGFGFGGSPSGCGCEGYGGGGGWYGGAGSGNCRGGGGGSGYTAPGASNVSHQTGVHVGNGKIILSW
ncbi:MAG: glycine-rich protein [Bacteroidota bacterium]